MNILQEKFQTESVDPKTNGGNEWVSDKSARRSHGAGVSVNRLPPGTNIEAQENADIHAQPFCMSGENDVAQDYNRKAVQDGYSKRKLSPTEDQYTREHNDSFYDEIKVDGSVGFVERNNYLDRG